MRTLIELVLIATLVCVGWFNPYRKEIETLFPGLLPARQRPVQVQVQVQPNKIAFQPYQASLRLAVQFPQPGDATKQPVILPAGTVLPIQEESGDNAIFLYFNDRLAVSKGLLIRLNNKSANYSTGS